MADTVQVRSGNKYLDIPADAVDRYVAKGYDVVDASGKVVVKSIPNEYNVLRAEYEKALETIKTLEAEIANLKADKKVVKPVVKEEPKEEIATPVEEPVTTRKRSKKN